MVQYKDKDVSPNLIPQVNKKHRNISVLLVILVLVGLSIFHVDFLSASNPIKQLEDAIAKDNSETLGLIKKESGSTQFRSYAKLQSEFQTQSANAPDPSRRKAHVNDGKNEVIDTSMDSRVVGTIQKGRSKVEKVDKVDSRLLNKDLRFPADISAKTEQPRTKTISTKEAKPVTAETEKAPFPTSKPRGKDSPNSVVLLEEDAHSIKVVDSIDKSK